MNLLHLSAYIFFLFARVGGFQLHVNNRNIISKKARTCTLNCTKLHAVTASLATNEKNPDGLKISLIDKSADILGYLMGFGANGLFLPIFVDLFTKKSANGYSILTWISSLTGLSLSLIYPFKKNYKISTYLEILTLSIQSFIILGIIAVFKNLTKEFFIGATAFLFIMLTMFKTSLDNRTLSIIQTISMIVCNYALVPQIILNHKNKVYSWSHITAFLAASGNAIRIFTTLQLTKDRLVLSGYIFGFFSNIILFSQYFLYPK